MPLTILSVAYPLAPVGPDAVGGAEQVLTQLDAALCRLGHRSIVIACEGSVTAGVLQAVPKLRGTLDEQARNCAHAQHRQAITQALERWPVDLVHMHGVDFYDYLPAPGVPVLVTLHLPPAWYPSEVFTLQRPSTYLHCVSASQRSACPAGATLLPEIANGVAIDAFAARYPKRRFALSLGRICPEKGFHIALAAAKRAGIPWLLAGEVFPYLAHKQYFRQSLQPHLDRLRRFVGPVGFKVKRRLLAAAQCLLAPSLVPETSSLAAMEALASGTPVIAFPAGALKDLIEHGKTGFLVNDEYEMAGAIASASALSIEACRAAARERFSLEQMVNGYLAHYGYLLSRERLLRQSDVA